MKTYNQTREIDVEGFPMTVFESPEAISDAIVRNNKFWEHHVFETWMPYFPQNGLMLDIGANIGNHCLMFRRFLPNLKIWAFEMSYNNFRLLYKNTFPYSDIKCFNVAVSDSFKMVSYKDSEDNNNGGISVHSVEQGEHLNVAIALDSLTIPEPITFIKIDIEGHERFAYEGMKDILLKYKPLIWAEDWVQSGHVQGESSIQYLIDLGYEVIDNIVGDFLLRYKG
jgi:FkbM family methyltransferase